MEQIYVIQCVSRTPGLTPGVLGALASKLPPPFCASPSAAYFFRSVIDTALRADSSVAWRKTLLEEGGEGLVLRGGGYSNGG